ncbi:YibE/F family protein [Nocardioides alcanivorans]|uniref:YibE/F family protein n=1 Tax=Nocardioides alcanivorans TaxID=2897352 RepID=UPI001F1DE95A|nr:YibE/F family protein [Nocardioides alcanivorans]
MGTHHHRAERIDTATAPRRILLGFLVTAGLAAVLGVILQWPHAEDQPELQQWTADGVTQLDAEVESVAAPCPPAAGDSSGERDRPEGCDQIVVVPATGASAGESVPIHAGPQAARSGVRPGDTVQLLALPQPDGADPVLSWVGVERKLPIGLITVGFVLVVAIVARLRGMLALVGLVFAAGVIGTFMLPALLGGGSGVGVALAGSTLIMFVVLYLTHGVSIRTSTALAGTLLGIAATALLGWWAVGAARLSGVSGEEGEMLASLIPGVNFQGLLMSAVIIAGLGVLNDVTITQSSAIWELRAAGPELTRRQLFASGMRIGRDHIASTIYTIVFAYVGTGLLLLMLLSVYDRGWSVALVDEALGEEVIRTLVTAIGLVLAVPITTAVAASTVTGPTTTQNG